MTATRYAAKELRGFTLRHLADIGTELGLVFNKNHNRADRARMILDVYNALDLQQPSASPPSLDRPALGEAKPEFERLIDGASNAVAPDDAASSQRGGERPGAGRPEGMTDEFAAYKRLSPLPHPYIKALLERFFDAWSRRMDCPEIKLSKDQAVALALAWTHAYEITPLAGRLPPWAIVLVECGWSTYAIVGEKIDLARDVVKRRTEAQSVQAPNLN